MNTLPEEVIFRICKYLDGVDVRNLVSAEKSMHRSLDNERFWKFILGNFYHNNFSQYAVISLNDFLAKSLSKITMGINYSGTCLFPFNTNEQYMIKIDSTCRQHDDVNHITETYLLMKHLPNKFGWMLRLSDTISKHADNVIMEFSVDCRCPTEDCIKFVADFRISIDEKIQLLSSQRYCSLV